MAFVAMFVVPDRAALQCGVASLASLVTSTYISACGLWAATHREVCDIKAEVKQGVRR